MKLTTAQHAALIRLVEQRLMLECDAFAEPASKISIQSWERILLYVREQAVSSMLAESTRWADELSMFVGRAIEDLRSTKTRQPASRIGRRR